MLRQNRQSRAELTQHFKVIKLTNGAITLEPCAISDQVLACFKVFIAQSRSRNYTRLCGCGVKLIRHAIANQFTRAAIIRQCNREGYDYRHVFVNAAHHIKISNTVFQQKQDMTQSEHRVSAFAMRLSAVCFSLFAW